MESTVALLLLLLKGYFRLAVRQDHRHLRLLECFHTDFEDICFMERANTQVKRVECLISEATGPSRFLIRG